LIGGAHSGPPDLPDGSKRSYFYFKEKRKGGEDRMGKKRQGTGREKGEGGRGVERKEGRRREEILPHGRFKTLAALV